jgi:transglutaminase-like putative cysteine protease
MMKFTTVYLMHFFILISLPGISGTELKYKVTDIPDDLRKNAKAVIRKNNTVFTIDNIKEAKKTVDFAITVLNKNGNSSAVFIEFYDKFTKIRNIRINQYNGDGTLIKHYNQADILDLSAKAGYSLYESNRVKVMEPKYRTPPYTLEYSYEVVYDGLLSYPDFVSYPDYNISVQEASFTLVKPENLKVRYLEQHITDNIQKEISSISYYYKFKDLPALKEESFSQNFSEIIPLVYLAPSDFELSGYKGNSDTWENFGAWINKLNTDRDKLPEETVTKLNKLVADARDDYEKIAILYKYMQDKTRYVSIQIGIGGWQPFDATTIDRLSYGDCKALANYMRSLLKAVGIKSFYTLVFAGEDGRSLLVNFPSNQFNHAILCVPVQNDTLWLECTNQQMPCGYQGKFTDDRLVLAIDENGGHLKHTTEYKAADNIKSQTTILTLNDDGDGYAKKNALYAGTYFDDMYRLLFSDAEDKKKLMVQQIHIPSFELVSFNHIIDKKRIPKIREMVELQLPNYGTKLNNTMFIPVNEINKFPDLPAQNTQRKSNIIIRRGHIEEDTIVINLPVDYANEKLPAGSNISTVFGEYKTELTKLGNAVVYVRRLKVNKGNYSPEKYNEFLSFFQKVSRSDDIKLVIKKI